MKQLASSLGVSGDLHELCHNEEIQEAVLKALNAVGKKSHLKALETLQTIVLTDTEWTPQNEMLTAAQKLNRKAILKKHKKEIDVRPSFSTLAISQTLTWLPFPLAGGLPVMPCLLRPQCSYRSHSIPPFVLSSSLRPLMTCPSRRSPLRLFAPSLVFTRESLLHCHLLVDLFIAGFALGRALRSVVRPSV